MENKNNQEQEYSQDKRIDINLSIDQDFSLEGVISNEKVFGFSSIQNCKAQTDH